MEIIAEKDNMIPFKQLCINWILAILTVFNVISAYSIAWPTLYNFVTNPQNSSCGSSGLGESETIYAIAASGYNGGIIISGLIVPVLLAKIHDYRKLLTIGPIIQILGGIMYALSTAGWMVILARFLLGLNYALSVPAAVSYISVSAGEHNRNREKQGLAVDKGLKKRLIIIYGLCATSSFFLSSVCVSLLTTFVPMLDHFRWIGWFNVGLSILIILLILCLFKHDIKEEKIEHEDISTSDEKNNTACLVTYMPLVYLLLAGYVTDSYVTYVDTVTSQILSDHFGFSTNYISYFFTGVLVFYPLSSIILLLSQKFKLSSRMMLLGSLVLGTIGITILSDWQSIPFSECSNVLNTSETSHSTSYCPTQSCIHVGNMLSNNCPLLSVNDDYLMVYFYKSTGFTNQLDCPSCNSNNCWQYQLSGDELCKLTEDISTNKHTISFESISLQGQPSNYSLCLSKSSPFITTNYNCSIELEKIITAIVIANSASEEQKICESNQDCYWNPSSVISGEYCTECLPACLSKSGSLHFIQLCIGMPLLIISSMLGHYTLYPIVTKITSPQLQKTATSLVVTAQALGAGITPLWMSPVYVATGYCTVIPSSIMQMFNILLLVWYCFFYRLTSTTKPKVTKTHRPSISSVVPLTAQDSEIATEDVDEVKEDDKEANSSVDEEKPKMLYIIYTADDSALDAIETSV